MYTKRKLSSFEILRKLYIKLQPVSKTSPKNKWWLQEEKQKVRLESIFITTLFKNHLKTEDHRIKEEERQGNTKMKCDLSDGTVMKNLGEN